MCSSDMVRHPRRDRGTGYCISRHDRARCAAALGRPAYLDGQAAGVTDWTLTHLPPQHPRRHPMPYAFHLETWYALEVTWFYGMATDQPDIEDEQFEAAVEQTG